MNQHFGHRAWPAQFSGCEYVCSTSWIFKRCPGGHQACKRSLENIFSVVNLLLYYIKLLWPSSAASDISNSCRKGGRRYAKIRFAWFTICLVQDQICPASYSIFSFVCLFWSVLNAQCPYRCYSESPRADLLVVGMLRFMSDVYQPSLPASFYSVLVSISVFVALSTVFHSRQLSVVWLCSSGLINSFQLYISLWKSPSALV